MANSNVPMFVQTLRSTALQLNNAAGTTAALLFAAGSNGSKIESLNVSSTDTVAHTLELYANDGTTNHLLAVVSIPASSGNLTAVPPVSLLQSTQLANSLPYDSNGNRYIYLATGWSLFAALTVAATSGDVVDIVASGGDF